MAEPSFPASKLTDASAQPAGGDVGMPLSLRPEWADLAAAVQGLMSDAGPGSTVVAIDYSEDDAETLAYFRAVVAAGETSARALQLTEEVILANPAHYTAWEWRWRCLAAAGSDLDVEEPFLRRCTAENPKNYQLWNYRRRLALARGPSSCAQQEMEAAAATLAVDSKNYHAWAHRQALVAAWGLWEAELAFTEAALADDVRNNSAWNQRFFILTRRHSTRPSADAADGAYQLPLFAEVAQDELHCVGEALRRAPDNGSTWAYLRGLLTLPGGLNALLSDERIPDLCCKALQQLPSCSPALAMLSEVYRKRAAVALREDHPVAASSSKSHADAVATALEVADPLRRQYWRFITEGMCEHTLHTV